jgi:hypothetical protein
MAVCPFCFPWPRTSVIVIPEAPIFSSASRTSSTLLGRMMLLISFKESSSVYRKLRRPR